MKLSCLRELASRQQFGTFAPSVESDPYCTMIGDKADGAKAASKVLVEYFTTINSLASFWTAKAGTDAQNLLSKTGAAVGTSSAAQTALGAIAQFIVTASTSGYQQKSLEKDLTNASGNVSAVVKALVTIVQDDYIDRQLASEEQKLSIRYVEFAQNRSPEVTLLLDERWHADEQALTARRTSARTLVTALQTLSKGFAELAENSHQLKSKDVPGLLAPYVSQIQTLIPQIQKAF